MWYERVIRTLLQMIVAAPVTVVVVYYINVIGDPMIVAALQAMFTIAVAGVQNYLEDKGKIPSVLKSEIEYEEVPKK